MSTSTLLLEMSAHTVFLTIMRDQIPPVSQDSPGVWNLFNQFRLICRTPDQFLGPDSRDDDRGILFSRVISCFRNSILSPISNYSDAMDFWWKLFAIMNWAAETPAQNRRFIREVNGDLACSTFSSVANPIRWDIAGMGCGIFVINLNEVDLSGSALVRLCQSIVLVQNYSYSRENVELLQDGIDLSGRKVRVRSPRTFIQNALYEKLSYQPFYMPTAIKIHGTASELIKEMFTASSFTGEVRVEQRSGMSLRHLIENHVLDGSQRKLLAFHLIKMAAMMHTKSPHGNLNFDTIFINGDVKHLEELNSNAFLNFPQNNYGRHNHPELNKPPFFLLHDHLVPFFLNDSPVMVKSQPSARVINGWLFQPFEMVSYMKHEIEVSDLATFYRRVDRWSLGAMVMVILFPDTIHYWMKLEEQMQKLEFPSIAQEEMANFIKELSWKPQNIGFLKTLCRFLQINPIERDTAINAFIGLWSEFKK